jgi:hypothetical protein
MSITFPSDTKDTIDAIRNAIGREITFMREVKTDCPVCTIDPFTGNSTNPFCVTCSGKGYTVVYSGAGVKAHITWGGNDQLGWVSGGQMQEGDCRVQVEYTSTNVNLIEDADYVLVDGKRMSVTKQILRGVQPINRILLDLNQEE